MKTLARFGALLAACAVLLTGCVQPPSAGPIQAGLAGPVADPQEPLIRPIANPPRTGMTPQEVVSGFLSATAAVREDYQVARKYLTPEASAAWNPGSGVTVMATAPASLVPGAQAVSAKFTQVGSVSSSGVYTGQSPAAGALSFPVVSVAGEWRIAQAPPGLLLSSAQLERAFVTRNVYFIDPRGTVAVPDLRVLPRTEPQALPTALVDSLLAGPSPWLAASASSELPDGLQLSLGAVPVIDGVARVELTGPDFILDAEATRRLGAQLAWTLGQVPEARAVQLILNGNQVLLQDRTLPAPFSAYASFDPDVVAASVPLYGLDDQGVFVRVAGDALQPVLPAGTAAAFETVAISPQMDTYAAWDGRALLIGQLNSGDGSPQVIATTVVGRPAIDAANRVWWVDAGGAVQVAIADRAGVFAPTAVPVVSAPGGISGVRPARDGTRIALLIASGDQMALHVGAVVSDPEHGLRIDHVVRVGDGLGVLDAAWHDAQELSVIDPTHGVVRRIDLLGTQATTFAIPAQAVTLADAPHDPLVLGLADQTAGGLTGNGVRVVAGLRAPVYPG